MAAQRVKTIVQEADFEPQSSVSAKSPPIVDLWVLRLMLPLGGLVSITKGYGCSLSDFGPALGLSEALVSAEPLDIPALRNCLIKRYLRQESSAASLALPMQTAQNVGRLAELVRFNNAETRILGFAIMLHYDRVLHDVASAFGSMGSRRLHDVLATLLDLPMAEVRQALRSGSALIRSGLISYEGGSDTLVSHLSPLSDAFVERIASSDIDPMTVLRETVLQSSPGHLGLPDFSHIGESLGILLPYLSAALRSRRVGVNVLVYGPPGTGKSQLTKTVAKEVGCDLFEVSGEDEDGDPVEGAARLNAYRAAQSLLGNARAMILFDEVQDVFESDSPSAHGGQPKRGRKAWINRVLEGNAIPAFWITNSVDSLDHAYIRRFDLVIELPVPPRGQREKITREVGQGFLDDPAVERLVKQESLAPAVVARAVEVARVAQSESPSLEPAHSVEHLVQKTLRAQGYRVSRAEGNALPDFYDPAFLSTDADLLSVAPGIRQCGAARICLYGPPGTGKTAWARWLAFQLDKPLITRRASDIFSMWLGESEKNVAAAFESAKADGAVLLIDEVDSFMQARSGAQNRWEIAVVNEMLTQMESYEGIFVASTNLMDDLDAAVLRRFDLKVKFEWLKAEQAQRLLFAQTRGLGLPEPDAAQQTRLRGMLQLAPGDFAVVARRHRFAPFTTVQSVLDALDEELALKCAGQRRSIGFLAG